MVESDGDDTLYEILGIDEDAPLDDVVKAYRQRALAEHPDKGGDVDRFDALKKAYEVLSDQHNSERDRAARVFLKQNLPPPVQTPGLIRAGLIQTAESQILFYSLSGLFGTSLTPT
eukprot:g1629.t1